MGGGAGVAVRRRLLPRSDLPGGHNRVKAHAATDEVGWLCHAPHGHQIDLGRILWGQANEYPQEILLRDGGRPAGLFHLRIT